MPTVLSHIAIDEHGVAWIEGANTKVIEVALDQIAHGWSPEEIHFQHPHLSLGQIHAALSYYHDHKAELDAEIHRRWESAERLRERLPAQPTRAMLVARWERLASPR